MFGEICHYFVVFVKPLQSSIRWNIIAAQTWKNLAPAEVFVVPVSPVQSPALAVPSGPQTIHLRTLTIR